MNNNEKYYFEKDLQLNKKTTIEIEDYYGNTIGGINLNTGEFFGDLSIADNDGDYLFDSNNILIKIQLEKR